MYLSSLTTSTIKRRLQWRIDHLGKPLRFRQNWCAQHSFTAENAVTVRVKDDAMSPMLENGSSIVIDTSDTKIVSGRVYAVDYYGSISIRRLYLEQDGTILFTADNSDKEQFPDWYLPLELTSSLRLLGRVVQRQTNL